MMFDFDEFPPEVDFDFDEFPPRDDDEGGICPTCMGSGWAGRGSGSCWACHGSGER